MLKTRLWMGALLIALTIAMLFFDERFAPWHPFLLLFFFVIASLGTVELLSLLAPARPSRWLCIAGVLGVALANWAHLAVGGDARDHVLAAFVALVLVAFLVEMATFREPGGCVLRIALTAWIVAYLGLLPSFLAQVRWLPNGAAALALCIFVPKSCDIGAYFTGRLIGRHRMTPLLSPKKTWEGLGGGMVVAALTAFGINHYCNVFCCNVAVLLFGVIVGGVGALGDLAESLIKRDCQRKDASAAVPGFGGILDVIDAVIFAAPVAFWLLRAWGA